MNMLTSWNENTALLRGHAGAEPVLSHQNHGTSYWTFPLMVPRLSGAEDRVNVMVAEELLELCPVELGTRVEAEGEVRSFNNRSGKGSRLVITLFARSLKYSGGEPCNTLVLAGAICKAPALRRTPLGREICDLLLAVNRKYGRADYLPCIAWGSLAEHCGGLSVGDGVRIEGRLQSRGYTKLVDGVEQPKIAYEISVMKLEAAEQ
ncbi:MAG: single-stranded DNA-binding protein [Pseudoflavonifractor sp.]